MAVHLPALHRHLTSLDITPIVYIMDWTLTLFTKPLQLEVASRVWDIYLHGDEHCLLRAALAVLRMLEAELLDHGYEQCMVILTHIPAMEEKEFFECMAAVPFSAKAKRQVRTWLRSLE